MRCVPEGDGGVCEGANVSILPLGWTLSGLYQWFLTGFKLPSPTPREYPTPVKDFGFRLPVLATGLTAGRHTLPPFTKHLNGALCQRVSGGGVLCGGIDFPSVSRPLRGIAAEAPTTATHAPGAHPRSCAIDDLGNTSGEPAAELWVGRSRQWGARTGPRGLSQWETQVRVTGNF